MSVSSPGDADRFRHLIRQEVPFLRMAAIGLRRLGQDASEIARRASQIAEKFEVDADDLERELG